METSFLLDINVNPNIRIPPSTKMLEQSNFSSAWHVITGIFWDAIYFLTTLHHRFINEPGAYPVATRGLAVFIHGMNRSPEQFHAYCEDIRALNKHVTIIAPKVKNRGHCAVDEAAQEIFEQISLWRTNNQNKPIVLVGTSNGGRLAALVGSMLADTGHPVKVVCIAAPLDGTELLNPNLSSRMLAVWQRIAKLFYHEKVVEELSYKSAKATEIVERVRMAAEKKVSYDFYGTLSDTQVRPISTAFPSDVKNSRHFLLKNAGHSSIVGDVKKRVVQDTLAFIRQQK